MSSCARTSALDRDFRYKLAAAVLIGAVIVALMPLSRSMKAQNDFAHWYIGGTLFGSPDLHNEAANQRLQQQLIGGVLEHSYFIRPTFYGLLLKPLSWFPYLTAYAIFQIFSVFVCLAYFLREFGKRWPDLYVYAAMSVPLISSLVNGQDVTLLLLFCTISLVLARKGHDFPAGLVFALCAIKLHLFVFTPVAMLAQRRWRIFWGAVAGEIALFGMGIAFGGGWPVFRSWVAILSKSENHPYPELMPNLRGLVYALTGGAGGTALWIGLSALVAAAVILLAIRAGNYEKAFAWCLIGGLMVNVHAYIQDPMLLLLTSAILLDGTQSKAFGITMQLALFPVAYVFLMWTAPYSATFSILILAALAFAVRDSLFARRETAAGALEPMESRDPATV